MKLTAKEANQLIPTKSKPIDLADTTFYETWMYVEERSIVVVHEIRNKDGSYLRTDRIKIPKRKLFN